MWGAFSKGYYSLLQHCLKIFSAPVQRSRNKNPRNCPGTFSEIFSYVQPGQSGLAIPGCHGHPVHISYINFTRVGDRSPALPEIPSGTN
jgi:hypothetical protein